MTIQNPHYHIHFDDDVSVFMYLIGTKNGRMFKFGVSQDPAKRLAQLKSENWAAYLGFPILNSEVLYKSKPIPSPLAYQAEAKWLIENKSSIPYEISLCREITTGDYDEVLTKYELFCNEIKGTPYYELEDPWLNSELGVFNVFSYENMSKQYIRIYSSSTYRPLIDVANVYRHNPRLEHELTFWGPHEFILRYLQSIAVKTITDDRYFIVKQSISDFHKWFNEHINRTTRSIGLSKKQFIQKETRR